MQDQSHEAKISPHIKQATWISIFPEFKSGIKRKRHNASYKKSLEQSYIFAGFMETQKGQFVCFIKYA